MSLNTQNQRIYNIPDGAAWNGIYSYAILVFGTSAAVGIFLTVFKTKQNAEVPRKHNP